MITEPDPAPVHGIPRLIPEPDVLERIADALETIAHCLSRVSSHQAIRVDRLL